MQNKSKVKYKIHLTAQFILLGLASVWLFVGAIFYYHDVAIINTKDKCIREKLSVMPKWMQEAGWLEPQIKGVAELCRARYWSYAGPDEKGFIYLDKVNFNANDVWIDNSPNGLAVTIVPIFLYLLSLALFAVRIWLRWLVKN